MAQTSYEFFTDVASEGLLADNGFKNCLSPTATEDIPIGRGVVKVVGQDEQVRLPHQNQSTITLDADLVTSNSIAISVNGSALSAIPFNSDHDTTMDDIAAALEALSEVDTAVVSGVDNRVITVTAEQGQVVVVDSFVVTGGASQATATIANVTQDSSNFYGVALRTQAKQNLLNSSGSNGPEPYFDGEAVSCLTQGRVYVKVEQDLNSDDDVYLRYVVGSSNEPVGQFRKDADSGKAFQVSGARWIRGASADGLAVLEFNMP